MTCLRRRREWPRSVLPRASPCTTVVSTTRSTACGSCPGRCSGLGPGVGGRVPPKAKAAPACRPVPGFFPVDLEHPDQLAERVAELASVRKKIGRDVKEPLDVVAALPVGTDPAPTHRQGHVVDGGVPWDGVPMDQVRGVIRDGAAPSG